MNKETWLGHSNAKFIYYSYKDSPYFSFLIIAVVLSISILLIFNVILPQMESWFSIRDETLATKHRIEVIEGNLSFISTLDKNTLERNRETVIKGLPVEKDFASIIDAITVSAAKSGVSVGDFVFGVGIVSSGSATTKPTTESEENTTISLILTGSIDGIAAFIKEIGEKLPLSEVDSVDTTEDTTTVSLVFFSKPYKAIDVPADQPIRPLSAENGTLLSEISKWNSDSSVFSGEASQRSDRVPVF